jgi:hypothetical protein
MKKLFLLSVFCISLLGCEKYVTGTYTTLSGKYLITRITLKSVDQNTTGDSTYRSGDVFIDPSPATPIPFDTIRVGYTFLHFDYGLINLRYLGVNNNNGGSDVWDPRYQTSYNIWGNNQWQEGYLQFSYTDPIKTLARHTCTFQITEDKFESLELVSSGKWPSYKFGEKKIMILNLTRVGP